MYLFSNWAASSHGTTIISPRARVPFSHFLTILSPLASIRYLQKLNIIYESNLLFWSVINRATGGQQNDNYLACIFDFLQIGNQR